MSMHSRRTLVVVTWGRRAVLTVMVLTIAAFLLQAPYETNLALWEIPQSADHEMSASLLTEEATSSRALSSVPARDFLKQASSRSRWSRYSYHAPVSRTEQDLEDASKLCGSGPDYLDYWNQQRPSLPSSKPHRSINDEDRTIYERFFKHLASRQASSGNRFTYVELGGYTGLEASNSRFFDTCLAWEGLLIEANPHDKVYPKLVQNRPHAHRMNFAASCSDEPNQTVGFHSHAWANSAQEDTENAYQNKTTVQVPCGSLTPVLLDLFDGHITFFSLDVEGAEPSVLEHLDLTQVMVEIFIVENFNEYCPEEPAHCESRDQYRALLEQAGYQRYDGVVKKSDLFVHAKSTFYSIE